MIKNPKIEFDKELERFVAILGSLRGYGKTEDEAIHNMYLAGSYGVDRDYSFGLPD